MSSQPILAAGNSGSSPSAVSAANCTSTSGLRSASKRPASHVYLVADSAEINKSSFTRLGTLDVVHSFITDDGIRDEGAKSFEARGIEVLLAK